MSTASQSLQKLFERDLALLDNEIKMYPGDDSLWAIATGTSNSGGNLCLHLCGNLQQYIGLLLGGVPYTRDRPYEFSAKGLSRDYLLTEISHTRAAVSTTLSNLSEEVLESLYPTEELGYPMTTHYFLIHLAGHLKYHLGQINYHRRILNP